MKFCQQVKYLLVLLFLSLGLGPLRALAVNFASAPLNLFITPPPNLIFDLSVEFPTAGTAAYLASSSDTQTSFNGYYAPGADAMVNALTAFKPAQTYDGYFDPKKCYTYVVSGTGDPLTDEYFTPSGSSPDSSHNYSCSSSWNGNFLNWLTMTKLDIFRKYLTGGERDVDSPTMTRLVRSWVDGRASELSFLDVWLDSSVVSQYTGITPSNKPYIIARANPSRWGQGGLAWGNGEWFWGCRFYCSPEPYGNRMRIVDPSDSSEGSGFNWSTMPHNRFPKLSVVVCSPSYGTESNCSPYYNDGTTQYYKPIGLIQQHQSQAYFGAFAYVNVDGPDHHAGGVMRSPLKAIDGSKSGSNPEIDPATGVFIYDPENLAGGRSSGVVQPVGKQNSGLINYINQFGSIPGASGWSYVRGDVTGELLYESLRYLALPYTTYSDKTASATPEYLKDITTGAAFQSITTDGFPIYTTYTDPLVNACQLSNIVFIGDANQNCDGRIPGGVYSSAAGTGPAADGTCPKFTPSNPIPGLDASTWVHKIESAEGGLYSDLTTSAILRCPNGEAGGSADLSARGCWNDITPNLPALAFWAHVSDIRSDLNGTQTVNFYTMDVHEQLAPGRTQDDSTLPFGQDPTPYWFAAKYGGFTFDGSNANPNTDPTSWSSNNDGVPDNFLMGDNPVNIKNGLQKIFDDLSHSVLTQSNNKMAVSIQTNPQSTQLYKTYYQNINGNMWEGNVVKSTPSISYTNGSVSYSTGGSVDFTKQAAGWLQDNTVNGNPRQIITATRSIAGGAISGVAFKWNNLSTYTQTMLLNTGDSTQLGSQRVNYLRGDRSLEVLANNPHGFRTRPVTVLGDIMDSSPVFVGPAQSGYSDADLPTGTPSYSSFVQNVLNRRSMVYVGANDGMLHGFDASTLQELFAFIPNSVLPKLKDLTSQSYQHEYFVDETPIIAEIPVSGAWTTQLIGFPGMGGTGVFALDITSPDNFRPDTNLSQAEQHANSIFLWELNSETDKDIGYILNRGQTNRQRGLSSQVGKMANNRWAVIVGNGYNSPNNTTGLVIIYLDGSRGTLTYKKIMIAGASGGLSTPTPVDEDMDGKIDYAYAGDLQGNLWRFDLRGNESTWSAFKLFQAVSPDTGTGVLPQPIVTGPAITFICSKPGLNIIFGTGKFFETSDSNVPAKSSIYGLWDDLSNTVINRSNLTEQTFTYSGIFTSSDNAVGSTQKGWFMDSWDRILYPPYVVDGIVYFNTMWLDYQTCSNANVWPMMFGLQACTGQRPDRGVFDTNNDGLINDSDKVYSSDTGGLVYASGVATSNPGHLFDSSQWLDPAVFQCATPPCDNLSVALSESVGVNLLQTAPKRASWREIIQNY